MKGFQNIFFYDLFVIWIRFPFMFFMGSNCGYVFLMVLGLFFFRSFYGFEMVLAKNQILGTLVVLWWEKASGKGKL
jgi:hypothetical protein